MRRTTYITVLVARTQDQAELIIGRLHRAGLHPAELGLTTPLASAGAAAKYPIEVPADEELVARKLISADDIR